MPKLPAGKVNFGCVRFPEANRYVVIAGKRLVLVCATSQFDLVMSSLAIFTGRLFSRAISTARESERTGASPEVSSPGDNIPAINAVPAIAQASCLMYFISIIVESTVQKHGPMKTAAKKKGTRGGDVVNDRSRLAVRSREEC